MQIESFGTGTRKKNRFMKNKLLFIFIIGLLTISSLKAQTRKEIKVNTVNNSTLIREVKCVSGKLWSNVGGNVCQASGNKKHELA